MEYSNYITINSSFRFGKACIKETRIAVADVLNWLASGMTTQQIIEDYPELTENDIRACLAYSADRERKIDIAK